MHAPPDASLVGRAGAFLTPADVRCVPDKGICFHTPSPARPGFGFGAFGAFRGFRFPGPCSSRNRHGFPGLHRAQDFALHPGQCSILWWLALPGFEGI